MSDGLSFYDPSVWERDPDASSYGHAPLVPMVDHGPVGVYFRNVDEYRHLIADAPYDKFAFTHSDVRMKVPDPHALLSSVLPLSLDFTWIKVNKASIERQTRLGHEAGTTPERIPVWHPQTNPEVLLDWCAKADDFKFRTIAIGWLPKMDHQKVNKIHEWVYRIAATYPNIKFHFAMGSSFRAMFGLNFASVDYNPIWLAKGDIVMLPSGRAVRKLDAREVLKWIHVLGFSTTEIKTLDGRVRFNIASALWAAENYRLAEPIARARALHRTDPLGLLKNNKNTLTGGPRWVRPTMRQKMTNPFLDPDRFPQSSPDTAEPYELAFPVINAPGVPVGPRVPHEKDKILCNSCSLAPTCRVYREGSICTLPTSATSRLATMFGTRDTEVLKGLLAEVLASQAQRYERSAEAFREDDESDILDLKRSAHLMSMENSLVRSTETLMKILDPKFRDSNVPSINASTTVIYNPQVLVADVVKSLEERGYDRSQISPEMIKEVVDRQPKTIQG